MPHTTRISERIAFFDRVAMALIEEGILPEDVVFRRARLPIVAKAYFLLSEVYKGWRIEPGHYTQLPKIAALQCLAIGTIQPFRPVDIQNAKTMAEARCNEIFALACAQAALGKADHLDKKNFNLRILDILSKGQSLTLEPFIVDVNLDIDRGIEDYKIPVHEDDKFKINCLITIFELISGHYD